MLKKISIVTINYNNCEGLRRTIKSIEQQDFKHYEVVVIDGYSNDTSIHYIQDQLIARTNYKVLIETDKGIYDAMNKGLSLVEGELVGFLNAGDVFNDTFVLSNIWKAYTETDTRQSIYGNKLYSDFNGDIVRRWNPGDLSRWKYYLGWMTPHLTTYIPRSVYAEKLKFDTQFSIAADYELMFRIFFIEGNGARYVNLDMVVMEPGGVSTSGLKNIIVSNFEVLKCWRKNVGFVPIWLFFTKPVSKLFQKKFIKLFGF